MIFVHDELKILLPILTAMAKGEVVQCRERSNLIWEDFPYPYGLESYSLDLKRCEFRVKPEVKMVPFDFSDASFLLGRQVTSKNNEGKTAGLILSVTDLGAHIHPNTETTYFGFLLRNYTFLDGEPCGKLQI